MGTRPSLSRCRRRVGEPRASLSWWLSTSLVAIAAVDGLATNQVGAYERKCEQLSRA